ncbi:histidinol-phosphate transaminase [Rhizobium sp. ZPR3]|uniref:Histidinol-phosphate aminotransferase n=2 Tax=unclassified Rhizobium TaxID=2613769 RepID=A0AAU7S9Q0_9HYPH
MADDTRKSTNDPFLNRMARRAPDRPPMDEPFINMALNENPAGSDPRVVKALLDFNVDISRYPDGGCSALKDAIANKFSVSRACIAIGNGTDDLLDLAARALLSPGRSAIFCEHAFSAYRKATELAGARSITVPECGWETDLTGIARAVEPDTSMIFISNPSNPAPGFFTEAAFVAFLKEIPDSVTVVLDEAYVEFVDPSQRIGSARLTQRASNLLVLRTFSKAYGLAGLRLGFGIGTEALIEKIHAVRQPFSIGAISQYLGVIALEDDQFVEAACARNRNAMARLVEGLVALDFKIKASQANFIILESDQAHAIQRFLLQRGIAVRSLASYGWPQALRITVGLEEQNMNLLNQMTSFKAG